MMQHLELDVEEQAQNARDDVTIRRLELMRQLERDVEEQAQNAGDDVTKGVCMLQA